MKRTINVTLLVLCSGSSPIAGQDQAHHVIFVSDSESGEIEQTISLPAFPEISPDGRYVAMDGWRARQQYRDAHVLIVDLETGELIDLGPGAMPSWSADGQWVAISKYSPVRGVFIRSVKDAEERLIDGEGWGFQWSPDGRRLAYVRDGNLMIRDLATESNDELFVENDLPYDFIYWNCKWSPDSRRICFKGKRSDGALEIAIVALSDDGPELVVRGSADGIAEDFAWHPLEPMILVPKAHAESGRLQLFAFDPDGTEAPTRWNRQPADRNNGGMSFSRDGRRIVYMSRD